MNIQKLELKNDDGVTCELVSDGRVVAIVDTGNSLKAAKLLAAAPRLLSALKIMMENVEEPPEPKCTCFIAPPCHDCVDHAALREAFEFAHEAISEAVGE